MRQTKIRNVRKAMTLIEVLVAATIFLIVVMGTLLCRYFGSRDVMRAEWTMDAQRLALVMLETWKGMGGTTGFDPTSDISTVAWEPSDGPNTPGGLRDQGSFATSAQSGRYYATLSYRNQTATTPILLHVSVSRMPPGQPWSPDTAQSMASLTSYFVSRGPQ